MLALQESRDQTVIDFLEDVVRTSRQYAAKGSVSNQIPALQRVDPNKLGLSILFADGREFCVGDAEEPFSIQSISKLFCLAMALKVVGDSIWRRVGREPSGMRYNSIVQLEQEEGIPRNPFMNSGAMVVVDAVLARVEALKEEFRTSLRLLSGNQTVDYDQTVYASESECGDLNRAIAYYLRARANLVGNPIDVVENYFWCCSVAMSCRDLAKAGGHLMGAFRWFKPIFVRVDCHFSAGISDADLRSLRSLWRVCLLRRIAGEELHRRWHSCDLPRKVLRLRLVTCIGPYWQFPCWGSCP